MDKEMNELFAVCEQDIQDLNKSIIESSAATAYNEVIFESAIDYILNEADEDVPDAEVDSAEEAKPAKAKAGFKGSLYKAWETISRMAKQLFNKLKVVLNNFIAKANAGNLDRLIEKNKDKLVSIRDYSFQGAPAEKFAIGCLASADDFKGSEEDVVGKIKAAIEAKKGSWKTEGLGEIKDFKGLNKFINGYSSKAPEDKAEKTLGKVIENGGTFKSIVAGAKAAYSKSVKDTNTIIKGVKATIDKTNTPEDAQAIKAQITNANKYLGFVYASYTGMVKWALAYIKEAAKGIKESKKAKPKNESVLEDFYGLSLL